MNPSPFYIALLVIHVMSGVLMTVGFYAVWIELLKKTSGIRWLRIASWSTAILGIISWVSAGWYYVIVYGSSVKSIVKAGPFPWAHTVIMESKEHIFIFLPVIAIAIAIGAMLIKDEESEPQTELKKSLAHIAGTSAILGMIVTLMGVLISGAVRG